MAKRIPSEKQIHAARLNGRKSRGPVTDPGKATSARNSFRHGILASSIIIEGESRDRFIALLNGLTDQFRPATEVESALVENLAVCRWRQMRIWTLEQASLTSEIRRRAADTAEPESPAHSDEDSPTRAALAFRTLCDDSRALEVLSRYEVRFTHQYNRALQALCSLRKDRPNPLVQDKVA